VPTLGALVSGAFLARFVPDARGSGIPQTRAAIFIHDGHISFEAVAGEFVCRATSLASGSALGREGPSVHVRSGIASVVARRPRLGSAQVRWLIPVGEALALVHDRLRQ
jgi:CIC family chloride channel protein